MSQIQDLRNKLYHINRLNRRQFIQYGVLMLGTSVFAACSHNSETPSSVSTSLSANSNPSISPTAKSELDKVTFGTNWFAQAEHGGFYQAVATGIYKDYGLDVTIKMGGPQVNGTQLLMGGAIDFFMGNSADAIKAIEQGIPKISVAAIFQKSPEILMAHPGVGNSSLDQLKGKPIFVSALANTTYWPFLKTKYGFTDEQKRPYNFNIGPFLADKNSAQQGYLTSEPFAVEKEGGFKPVIFLLADFGYTPYDTTIETTKKLVETNPDLVQRFVDASIKGWYSYLDNPAPGNELIKKDNPQMADDQIAYGLQTLKEYGIINSGDAETKGIGVMTDVRWKIIFDTIADPKSSMPDTKYKEAFTLKFVGKGVQAYKS
ncbi:nitrate ABC transporter substrate-binding protein [Scytonema hofmannii PCC 7110]|uniref:Nitrate ABC transporter substrate-binding protein n=1 Tax=Scytonema hofmannii PCC 7110 TaxID=128403 RepID=A0A139XHA6_9CYAN|nr:ABC transporter substrate-binding protein [Scytonema hofmannii]KYC44076.1 nitrate ABC transporter substrate-binding protein [Scytonema hofmannii PCC 7110]